MHNEESADAKSLTTLLEMSQPLSGTLNLKHSLHRILEILEKRHGVVRAALSLF